MRSWPSYGELTRQKIDDMEAAEDADPRGKRDPRDFALWKGWKKESEPETAAWPSPVGSAAGRAGTSSARRWPASTSAPPSTSTAAASTCASPTTRTSRPSPARPATPFASYWLHNAWITTAGEKMSKSLGNSLLIPDVLERVRGIELRYYMVAAHYRSHVEFCFEALDEAAAGFRRIEAFLERAGERSGAVDGRRIACADFVAAMDDDLGTPGRGRASIHDAVREGNKLLADGRPPTPLRGSAASVLAMLDVLGPRPGRPGLGRSRRRPTTPS